jgi:hypothetical protein
VRHYILLCLLLAFCFPPEIYPAAKGNETALRGKIIIAKGRPPFLQTGGKEITLRGAEEFLAKTLEDGRISGKQLELKGKFLADGSFEVSDIFTVHPDGLYKVIYFCNVCHITAFSPGRCVCCQRPTELEEVPLTDPRVHHETVKGPPSSP